MFKIFSSAPSQDFYSEALREVLSALASPLASNRTFAALVIWHWAGGSSSRHVSNGSGANAVKLLNDHLACPGGASQPSFPLSPEPYLEASPFLQQMHRDVAALAAALASTQLPTPLPLPAGAIPESLTADQALVMLSAMAPPIASDSPTAIAVSVAAQRLQVAASSLQTFEQYLHGSVLASCAAAAVRAGPLPAKLNGVIQVRISLWTIIHAFLSTFI